jgi:hypothetical protein
VEAAAGPIGATHRSQAPVTTAAPLPPPAVRPRPAASACNLAVARLWRSRHCPVQLIREAVDAYPFLAMDTEFPGVVARPVGNFKNSGEYHYQTLRQDDGWLGAGCCVPSSTLFPMPSEQSGDAGGSKQVSHPCPAPRLLCS